MSQSENLDLIYPLDAWPPPGRCLLLSLQWLFLMLPICVIPASVLSYAFGLSIVEQAVFLQRILMLTGLTTAVQALLGNKLSLVCGPASVLIVAYLAAGGKDIYGFSGAMIIGGALLIILGMSGQLKRLVKLFTPNVVAVILILVAVALIPVITKMITGISHIQPYGDPQILLRAVALALLIVFMSQYLPGFSRPFAIFIGIIIGLVINFSLGLSMPPAKTVHMSWVSLPSMISFSKSHYTLSTILPFLFCYLALVVNEVGSVQGMGVLLQVEDIGKRQDRSFVGTGLANLICGLFGSIGLVSYSLSPGVVSVTRVASRHVLMIGGLLLFICGLSQKLSAYFTLIPSEVVGASLLAILGTQIGSGISILVKEDGLTVRDFIVIGFPIILSGAISYLPSGFFGKLPITLGSLLSNSMVVGVFIVLILEHGLRVRKKGIS